MTDPQFQTRADLEAWRFNLHLELSAMTDTTAVIGGAMTHTPTTLTAAAHQAQRFALTAYGRAPGSSLGGRLSADALAREGQALADALAALGFRPAA